MQLVDGQLLLSASDLINFLECEHLTYLDREVALQRITREQARTDSSALVAEKGEQHEVAYLEQIRGSGTELVEVGRELALDEAGERTLQAMRSGADMIYQAAFRSGRWRGHADFLQRVPTPSELGDFSYEVLDTKLARRVKPYFLLQLCFYSELLAEAQRLVPERMHVVLGTHERESFRLRDFAAFYRALKRNYEAVLDNGLAGTYPLPVEHCGFCRWSDVCDQRRTDDDHLSLVARLGRPQVARLEANGITTVAALAKADADDRPRGMGADTYERLRQQARLQVAQRADGELRSELLQRCPGRGFALLPEPDAGDVFFDIEGDPFYEEGLEYLFGLTYLDGGEPRFKAFWGRDRQGEKAAFEALIDWLMARRQDHPGMHVYHYAHYEPTALKRLMGLHATREDEVDELLRGNALVDLYRVVEQALRISQPSYSLKKVEAFYRETARETEVTEGADSILMFEEWLDTGSERLLEAIERYNEDDCRSTYELREWLLAKRAEAIDEFGDIPWRAGVGGEPSEEQRVVSAEIAALQERLLAGGPEEAGERDPDQQARWLLAQLLDYHRRDAKPAWWEYFSRLEKTDEELLDDAEALGGLELVNQRALPHPKQSTIYTLRFPPQEHRIAEGDFVDPATHKAVSVVACDNERGLVEIQRGTKRSAEPLPRALIPGGPYDTTEQRRALRELGEFVAQHGPDADGPYAAGLSVLRRTLPRTTAVPVGEPLQTGSPTIDHIQALAGGLDQSHLFIQGPPGSGKTYRGALIVLDLISRGHRVGIAAPSHKAIHGLLEQVERLAGEIDVDLHALHKASTNAPDTEFESKHGVIDNSTDRGDFPGAAEPLLSGTAWLWAWEGMRDSVDYLLIDEAGQVSLADALAMATAARNLILLGDPLQLAQVSQGTHPEGAGASVLEHLLGGAATVPEERGVFLDKTRRMHPDVCEFISTAVYDDRLGWIPECADQGLVGDGLAGTGVRRMFVESHGRTRQSPEEADVIAEQIEALRGARYTLADGTQRELGPEDIMVVTPYNAQVRCLRERIPAAVRVGTVDRFQGQEDAVVFYSMATSSGDEIPRSSEFLFSRNRLNVAISRAKCLAVLVASPELLHIRCKTIEQMQLANALCLLVEVAEKQANGT